VTVNLTKRLLEKLSRKPYRDAYVAENVRTGIAYQIRALREQRNWNQGTFSDELGKPQSVTSRLEDPDYGKMSLATLLEVASAFDVGLVVKYVSFPEFLRQYKDVSADAFRVGSFAKDAFVVTLYTSQLGTDIITTASVLSPAHAEAQSNIAGMEMAALGFSGPSYQSANAMSYGPSYGAASVATASLNL
jgi:transcriptional regulator with XRE-family HTH domain